MKRPEDSKHYPAVLLAASGLISKEEIRKDDLRDDQEWKADCLHWRGVVLTGVLAHWCWDWDFLPVDETTSEIEGCCCDLSDLIKERITG